MLGVHYILELYDCNPEKLKNRHTIEEALLRIAKEANTHTIGSFFHQFKPYGVSGVIIIEESHISIHTWPEHSYAAIDFFACSDDVDFDYAVKSLVEYFESKRYDVQILERGKEFS